MRVLLAHNFYRSTAPSGEDTVYHSELSLLKDKAEPIIYERHNDSIDESTLTKKISLALDTAWSRKTYEELNALIRKTRPDIAHFHNTFPLISPSAYAACQDNGVPVVQTVQNYRFICPNALLLRNGKPCEDCVGASLIPALRYRCYRDSFAATSALVWTILSNRWRGTYSNLVNRYIAPTQFVANKLVEGGLPKERMEVKPNFLPSIPEAGTGLGGYALFVGRLSPEKGVRTLIEAWPSVKGLPLKIAGEGPLRSEIQARVNALRLSAEFLGCRQHAEVLDLLRGAVFLIVPSEWYEGFPMVVVEAFACGTPVVASRIGSLDEVVVDGETGLKFEAGNPIALAAAVNKMMSQDLLTGMREKALSVFLANYTADRNFERLVEIYESARDDTCRFGHSLSSENR